MRLDNGASKKRALERALGAIEREFGPNAIAFGPNAMARPCKSKPRETAEEIDRAIREELAYIAREEAAKAAWEAARLAKQEKFRTIEAELARIAKIPAGSVGKFSIWNLLVGVEQVASFRAAARKWEDDKRVIEAEKTVRAAYAAVRALSPLQQTVFDEALRAICECNEIVGEAGGTYDDDEFPPREVGIRLLAAMVEAFARITGKSPTFELRRGRGRRKGAIGGWQFQHFVEELWRTVNEHGGKLTFSCKDNKGSGSMVDALETLRPLLPQGFIPKQLPAKTIGRIKSSLNKKSRYSHFLFTSSVSPEIWDPKKSNILGG
jgi:hypothetical protein